jgi:hypothetical protein
MVQFMCCAVALHFAEHTTSAFLRFCDGASRSVEMAAGAFGCWRQQ